jgi:membrane-associated HD superfamily phosphohydrolase
VLPCLVRQQYKSIANLDRWSGTTVTWKWNIIYYFLIICWYIYILVRLLSNYNSLEPLSNCDLGTCFRCVEMPSEGTMNCSIMLCVYIKCWFEVSEKYNYAILLLWHIKIMQCICSNRNMKGTRWFSVFWRCFSFNSLYFIYHLVWKISNYEKKVYNSDGQQTSHCYVYISSVDSRFLKNTIMQYCYSGISK